MIQAFLLATILGFASCGRLENLQYLPPNQRAQNAGFQGSQGTQFPQQPQASLSSPTYSGQHSASVAGQYQGKISANNDIPIVRFDNNNDGEGHYNYALETGNGITAHEQGEASDEAGTRAQGGFSYTSPEGEHIQISYAADENGFIPQGAHLPTPPPIPEDIQKAIEQNLADEARGIVDDGQYKPEANEGQYNAVQYGQNPGAFNKYVPPVQTNQGMRQKGLEPDKK